MTQGRLDLKVKVVGHVFTSPLPHFKINVKGRGQGQQLRSNFWCSAVDIRGSALPSAAKSSTCLKCFCVCNQCTYADNCWDSVNRSITFFGMGVKLSIHFIFVKTVKAMLVISHLNLSKLVPVLSKLYISMY